MDNNMQVTLNQTLIIALWRFSTAWYGTVGTARYGSTAV